MRKRKGRKDRGLILVPMASLVLIFDGHGEGINGFNRRNQEKERGRKAGVHHGLLG